MRVTQQSLWAVAVIALTVAGLSAAPNASADTVVIVHPSNTAALDDETISKIFQGQTKSFPGGAEASPVDLKEGATREDFSGKVLKRTTAQIKAYWARQIFTGGARPPKELDSEESVVKFVASTPGAIGYVDASKAGAGVKVLKR